MRFIEGGGLIAGHDHCLDLTGVETEPSAREPVTYYSKVGSHSWFVGRARDASGVSVIIRISGEVALG